MLHWGAAPEGRVALILFASAICYRRPQQAVSYINLYLAPQWELKRCIRPIFFTFQTFLPCLIVASAKIGIYSISAGIVNELIWLGYRRRSYITRPRLLCFAI